MAVEPSGLVPGNHANHINETGNGSEDDADDEYPVRVQPIIEELADQQTYDDRRRNDESNLRVAGPHDGGTLLVPAILVTHIDSVPLEASKLRDLRPRCRCNPLLGRGPLRWSVLRVGSI